MASETTFDHWKVVFSWGKVRKRALTFGGHCFRFWDLHFWNRHAISEHWAWKKNDGYFFDLTGPQYPSSLRRWSTSLFRSYNHFYRAECIAVSGYFWKKIGNNNLCLTRCTNPTLLNVIWRVTCLQPAQMFFSTLDTSSLQYQHLFLPISIGGFWKYLSWTIWFQKIYLITIVKYLLEILIPADTSKGSNL